MVAMALAVCFMLVTSALEVSSIRYLTQLRCRENAYLVMQETRNVLRPKVEQGRLPAAGNQTVERAGVTYTVQTEFLGTPGATQLQIQNTTVPVAQLEARAVVAQVTVRWSDPIRSQPLELSERILLSRLAYQEKQAAP